MKKLLFILIACSLFSFAQHAKAAIATDAFTDGGFAVATSLTFSATVTGSNPILFVGNLNSTSANNCTDYKYNGVAMTKLVNAITGTADRYMDTYYLINPATGAHNVVINCTASDVIAALSASYTGVKQSGFPDASQNTQSDTGTSNTNTLTTVADNAWHGMSLRSAASPSAGTGATIRVTEATIGNMAYFDSNGVIHPAGSHSMTANWAASAVNLTEGFSFAPVATTINNALFFGGD